ncbi:MAG: YegS/Rv2252/BmrU family lipid kinase [Firmicutes bacterium]|nr:YegS/Rv2252/BmrU family lipid kinase [Bacillota bacterium]
MSKKALIIINPCSGTKRANKYLTDIVDIFTTAGYVCTVLTTTKRGDGTIYAREYASKVDLITAIGGDGTFNEVASGVIESGERVPIGYIPAGSTNDFASSLEIPKNILAAARDVVNGEPVSFDVGSFNGRNFSYVASFGAFTKASYATPQNVKNALGHLAYILEGINSIASIRKEHMIIEAGGQVYEDDYIFGAISNSTSLAGILTLNPKLVDMSDGLFELLLIKAPKDPIDLAEIIYMLNSQNYESNNLVFINCSEFRIHADKNTSWSLDGEYQEGCEEIEVKNLHHAIELMMTGRNMKGNGRHE